MCAELSGAFSEIPTKLKNLDHFPPSLRVIRCGRFFTFSNMTNNGLDNRRTRRVIIL